MPEIIEQNSMMFKRGAAALDTALRETEYLIENQFSVTDIIVGYTVSWGQEQGLFNDFPSLLAYLERLFEREHCTLIRN